MLPIRAGWHLRSEALAAEIHHGGAVVCAVSAATCGQGLRRQRQQRYKRCEQHGQQQ